MTSYDQEKIREQRMKNSKNVYYEEYDNSFNKMKETNEGLYNKLKLESDTLVDEFYNDILKLTLDGKINSIEDVYKYYDSRNLLWGRPSDNVTDWIIKKLRENKLIDF